MKGRYIIGREVMALMGIPIHRLRLKASESAPWLNQSVCLSSKGDALYGRQCYGRAGVSSCAVRGLAGVQGIGACLLTAESAE